MKFLTFITCSLILAYANTLISQPAPYDKKMEVWKSIVVATKKLEFHNFPKAFNPSLAHTNIGVLLTFRYLPDPNRPWISQIGIVRLDENTLEPNEAPQILQTRSPNSKTPSQAEDARVYFSRENGKTYILYNDNVEIVNPTDTQRRDIFIAQLDSINGTFVMSEPTRLYHYDQYRHVKWQKNWFPFEYDGILLLNYSINPHEILYPNLMDGKCVTLSMTKIFNNWKFGKIRGGTPALMVDGEYVTFFHSSMRAFSPASPDDDRYHYFMGAYAFSSEPPFEITKITPLPLVSKGFYEESDAEKRVIFPGGYFIKERYLHVAYGRNDSEIWIASIDKDLLKANMVPVQEYVDENVLLELFDFK